VDGPGGTTARLSAAPTSPPAARGSRVGGRYVLVDQVGSGGMGTVWRGYDELLRRPVAVKEVRLPAGLPTAERGLLVERTHREARAAAALNHPAVVRVYDVVVDDQRPWIIMELLDARSLTEIVAQDGPLPERTVAAIGLAVLDALEVAHRDGVLHRDVKPGNVLLAADGRTTLTDFGVARTAGDSTLTSTGLLLGSPQYIAPERARGLGFGPASDLFSLGATLYTAVEGRAPFDRGEPLATMTAVVTDPPAPMLSAGGLSTVLLRLLDKDPDRRATHAEARAGLLEALGHGHAGDTLEDAARQQALVAATVQSPISVPRPTAMEDPTLAVRVGRPGSRQLTRRGTLVLVATAAAAVLGLALVGAAVGAFGGDDGGRYANPERKRSESTAQASPYTHPAGFTIDAPPDWRPTGSTPMRLVSPDGTVWLQLYSQRTAADEQADIWRAADRANRRSDARNPGYRLVGIRDAVVGGHPGAEWEWVYERTGETEPRRVLGVGVVIDGVTYQVSLSAPVSRFDDHRAVLAQAQTSLRVN